MDCRGWRADGALKVIAGHVQSHRTSPSPRIAGDSGTIRRCRIRIGTWQDGYVIDIPYTAGCYRELSPAYLNLLAALLGVRASTLPDREFSYCELGCGWGLGPLLLAATNPQGRFHGYDINATQIARATQLAARAGLSNAHLSEESFASLVAASARHDESIRFLAAPVLGSGFFVAHPEQLLLLALREFDASQVGAIRDFVWAKFKAKDQRLVKDGQQIEAEADNLVELERRVRNFLQHRLPLLRRLGVVN